jgi:hypothetical protein
MTPSLLPAAFRFGRSVAKLFWLFPGPLLLGFGLQIPAADFSSATAHQDLPDLRAGDVVAFIGGEDVAAQKESGHLETLLSVRFPRVTFRNLGWEGDTVFAQPRDVGFPDLLASLKSAGATVIIAQFGRTEALSGSDTQEFGRSCGKLLQTCTAVTPRMVLVTPPPYENGGGLLPDLSTRNSTLAAYVDVLRQVARERQLPVVDLFSEFGGATHQEKLLTENGLHLTSRGQGLVALAFTRQLNISTLAKNPGVLAPNGTWNNVRLEQLRQRIIGKDALWFNYYRPQNWAFLGGDRTSQPSSRDHLDPKVRWFPAEMEKFVPLIRAKEQEIEKLASSLR